MTLSAVIVMLTCQKKHIIVKTDKSKRKGEERIKNRSHGKVDKLPEMIRKEVENRLLEGYTYEEIASYLKEMGHTISKTSIHRYGKPFL